jgi:hypothetical protein
MNTFDSMSDKQDDQLAARLGKKKRLAWDASSTQKKDEDLDKPLPKGVVLDKDGKPYVVSDTWHFIYIYIYISIILTNIL